MYKPQPRWFGGEGTYIIVCVMSIILFCLSDFQFVLFVLFRPVFVCWVCWFVLPVSELTRWFAWAHHSNSCPTTYAFVLSPLIRYYSNLKIWIVNFSLVSCFQIFYWQWRKDIIQGTSSVPEQFLVLLKDSWLMSTLVSAHCFTAACRHRATSHML